MMNLKRGLVLVSLCIVSLPAVAGDINNIQALSQPNFRLLSEDLGAALSYKPLTPTAPLGITGFDLGIAATSTKLQNSSVFATAGGGNHSSVIVPSLRLNKGLDLSISKGFLMFTPYGGIGKVWVDSNPVGTGAATGRTKESFSVNKVFVGLNMNFGLTNLAFEADKTGDASSV